MNTVHKRPWERTAEDDIKERAEAKAKRLQELQGAEFMHDLETLKITLHQRSAALHRIASGLVERPSDRVDAEVAVDRVNNFCERHKLGFKADLTMSQGEMYKEIVTHWNARLWEVTNDIPEDSGDLLDVE